MSVAFQLMSFEIDGLNLANEVFNYNNKLFFSRPKIANNNIVNAFVVIERPMANHKGGYPWESNEEKEASRDYEEALRVVKTFLACYSLINRHTLAVAFDSPSSTSVHRLEDVLGWVRSGGINHPFIQTNKPKLTVKDTIESLNSTVPLFNKINLVFEKSKEKINPLQNALLAFQQSIQNSEMSQKFLNLITVIESLIGAERRIKSKFVSRTSFFIETDSEKRKIMIEKLNSAYLLRNKLIHGDHISAYQYDDYYNFKLFLEPIARKVLLRYIELASQGQSKKEIIKNIDDKFSTNS